MKRAMFLVGVGLLLAATAAAPALAQTTTTNYQPGGCGTSTNLGSTAPGGTVSGTIGPSCHFAPGSTLNITVNGASGGTKSPNASGGVNVSLQVVSTTQGLLNDPVAVPVQVGTNTIVVTGPAAAGGTATVTGTFTVTAQTTTTAAGGGTTGTTTPSSTVAFTGANILRWSLAAAA